MFSSLIGHEKVKEFLTNSLNKGKIAHAYIFCGPENLGKTKTAEIFAGELLNQPSREAEEEFGFLKNNPDFTLIEREINEKTRLRSNEVGTSARQVGKLGQKITINQIRKLREKIQSTSLLGGTKVVVVKEADLMNLESANAFLKNLEEPRGDAVIILLVNNLAKLPVTIVSRCQIIYFHSVSPTIIKEHLVKSGAEEKRADLVVSLSGSRPGLAMQLLKDEDLLNFYKEQMQIFLGLFDLPLSQRLSKIREIMIEKEVDKVREKLYTILGVWMTLSRALMHKTLNVSECFFKDNKQMESFIDRYSYSYFANLLEKFHLAGNQLKANVNPRLIMENLVINIKN